MTASFSTHAPEGMSQPRRGRVALVVVAGLVIAALQLGQWYAIESSRGERYRVLSVVRDDDLVSFAVDNDATAAQWYGLAVAISRVAPNADVALPAQAGLTLDRWRSILVAAGKVSAVEFVDAGPVTSLDGLLDPERSVVTLSGAAVGGVDEWMLITGEGPATSLLGVVLEGSPRTLVVIDARVLADPEGWTR